MTLRRKTLFVFSATLVVMLVAIFGISRGAFYGPGENAWPLGLQLLRQVRVTLGLRDSHTKRDQVQAPPDRLVHSAKLGLMVAPDSTERRVAAVHSCTLAGPPARNHPTTPDHHPPNRGASDG